MKGFLEEYGLLVLETVAGLASIVAIVFALSRFSELADFVASKLMG